MFKMIKVLFLMVIAPFALFGQSATYTFHYGNTKFDPKAYPYTKAKEFNLSWGDFAPMQLGYLFKHSNWSPVSNTGNLFFTLREYINKNESLGISCGWQKFQFNHSDASNVQNPDYMISGNLLTLAIEYKKRHYWGKRYQIYSLIGSGVSYYTEQKAAAPGIIYIIPVHTFNTNRFVYAGQITPIAISAGNRFSAFAELGFGYKGIFNCGFSYVLPNSQNAFPHIENRP